MLRILSSSCRFCDVDASVKAKESTLVRCQPELTLDCLIR